jgi:hypothetical protein
MCHNAAKNKQNGASHNTKILGDLVYAKNGADANRRPNATRMCRRMDAKCNAGGVEQSTHLKCRDRQRHQQLSAPEDEANDSNWQRHLAGPQKRQNVVTARRNPAQNCPNQSKQENLQGGHL